MEIQEKATPSLNIDRNSFETVKLNVNEFDNHDDKLDSLFGSFNNNSEINTFVYEKIEKESLLSKLKDIEISKKVKVVSLASIFTLASAIIGINFISQDKNNIDATASTKIDTPSNIIQIEVKQEKKEEQKPEFVIHKVAQNDTLSTIAVKYNTTIDNIIKSNNIKNPHFLSLDTELKIPTSDKFIAKEETKKENNIIEKKSEIKKTETKKLNKTGLFHTIKPGETIGYLAQIYGVSESNIFASNTRLNPFNMQIGQKIFIPGTLNRNKSRKTTYLKSSRSISSPNYSSGRMIWPAQGDFSSAYGYRGRGFHSGIDIANNHGAPIYSAMSGYVISSGWDYAYGKSIKIKHDNGLITRYAHCSEMNVSVGQYVEAGQTIGKIGSTGRATGPHLHFEVIANGRTVNPRNYF